MQVSEKKKAAEAASAKATAEADDSNTVTWQGKTYKYNQNLSNYLLLGVDKRTPAETRVGKADAGQADALFLLSLNRKTKEMTMISIPRDTMTDVESFDLEGKSLGKSKDHISLSYGYGDGGAESCKLTQEAVSNLFYGLPIQGYLAMNLDGIPELTKSVGGLTVTVPNNSLEYEYPEFAEGAEVTLTEENTEVFLRSRDVDESQSAIYRMERQKGILMSVFKKWQKNATSKMQICSKSVRGDQTIYRHKYQRRPSDEVIPDSRRRRRLHRMDCSGRRNTRSFLR